MFQNIFENTYLRILWLTWPFQYLSIGLVMLIRQVVLLQEGAQRVIVFFLEQIVSLGVQRNNQLLLARALRSRIAFCPSPQLSWLGLLIFYEILVCPSLNHYNYFVTILALFTCLLILCFMLVLKILNLIIILHEKVTIGTLVTPYVFTHSQFTVIFIKSLLKDVFTMFWDKLGVYIHFYSSLRRHVKGNIQ